MAEQPVTKRELEQALAQFKTEFKTEFKAELMAELEGILDSRDDRLREMIRDMQTELLKAFLPFQDNMQLRLRSLEIYVSNNDAWSKDRLDLLERRVTQIERKLLVSPPTN